MKIFFSFFCLIWWRSGTNVNMCLLCTSQASFTVYQGQQQQPTFQSSKLTGWCLDDLWPSPLPGSVCVCLCHDCGQRCDLTQEWCAAKCENWEPINTLPFFTPHICFMLIVALRVRSRCLFMSHRMTVSFSLLMSAEFMQVWLSGVIMFFKVFKMLFGSPFISLVFSSVEFACFFDCGLFY